jgi:hypothetical protein
LLIGPEAEQGEQRIAGGQHIPGVGGERQAVGDLLNVLGGDAADAFDERPSQNRHPSRLLNDSPNRVRNQTATPNSVRFMKNF